MIFQYVLLFGVIFAFVFITLLIYHYYILAENFNAAIDIQNEINSKQHKINQDIHQELTHIDENLIDIIEGIEDKLPPKTKRKLSIYSSPIINND